jgi:hypoxanthine phosphoribosyltransferase
MSSAPPEDRFERRRHPAQAPAAKVRFAHPSERVFASLLDLYGIAWVYEPVEFTLSWNDDGGRASGFRPDFWLPTQRCFVELTTADQRLVTRKNAKVRRFRELYPDLDIAVVYQREFYALAARHGIELPETSAA